MIQSKAFDLLKELKKKEFQQFEKYLNSSFFTSNKNLKKLYTFLKNFYPSFENAKVVQFKPIYTAGTHSCAITCCILSSIPLKYFGSSP